MTVSVPVTDIVTDASRTGPGRLTDEQRETRTPAGRSLQTLESQIFTISVHALTYRDLAEIRRLHDAEHDRCMAIAEACIARGDLSGALDAIRDAMAADALEDHMAAQGDGIVVQIHAVSRRVAGWIEAALVRLRGGR